MIWLTMNLIEISTKSGITVGIMISYKTGITSMLKFQLECDCIMLLPWNFISRLRHCYYVVDFTSLHTDSVFVAIFRINNIFSTSSPSWISLNCFFHWIYNWLHPFSKLRIFLFIVHYIESKNKEQFINLKRDPFGGLERKNSLATPSGQKAKIEIDNLAGSAIFADPRVSVRI